MQAVWGNPTLFNLLNNILRKNEYGHNQLRKVLIDESVDPRTAPNTIFRDSLI